MLNSGVVEIDKERKRLVKAAHSAQTDLEMVRQDHEEVSRHLQMREMEIESMAGRIHDQERRLEGVTTENTELKCVIDQLDSQLGQAKTLLEESEYELKEKEHHWHDEKTTLDQQLSDRDDKISTLSQDLSSSAKLNDEQSHTIDNQTSVYSSLLRVPCLYPSAIESRDGWNAALAAIFQCLYANSQSASASVDPSAAKYPRLCLAFT